jgi:hypothetical protein
VDIVPAWIQTLVAWSDVVSNFAQVVALLVGAAWAYNKFVLNRERWPRATLAHQVQHFDLEDGRRLVRVVEEVRNPGSILVQLSARITRLQQVLPMEASPLQELEAEMKQEAGWLQIGEHKAEPGASEARIEPGETDRFEHDFLIDDEVEVLQIYSHMRNVAQGGNSDLGWTLTTLYDIRSDKSATYEVADLTLKEE